MDVQSNGRIFLRDQVEIPITNGSIKALSANYDSNGKRIDEITQGNIYYLDSYFKFQSGSLNETSKLSLLLLITTCYCNDCISA